MKAIVITDRHKNKGEKVNMFYSGSQMFYRDERNREYHISEFVSEEDVDMEIEKAEERIRYYSNKLEVLRRSS